MTILTADTRELTDVNPIQLDVEGIIFSDLKVSGNAASDFLDMVRGNHFFTGPKTQRIEFDEGRLIFDMGSNHFVVEYKDEGERKRDIAVFQDKFNQDEKTTQSIPVKDGRQEYIPEYDGKFEYNGKFYVILHARHKLGETNTRNGVYKGVIVNPDTYFSDEAQRQVQDGSDATNRILDGE